MNTSFFRSEVLRFIIVGVMNTANYYILYLLFLNMLDLNYMLSHITAFILSMIGSFFLNSYFTYRTKPTWKKFIQFPVTYVVNITVTSVGVFLLVDILGLNEIISPLIASIGAIPFTFLVSKKILKNNR